MIKRQNYLLAFPGYHSFPGGKVDKGDEDLAFRHGSWKLPDRLLGACKRELLEELNYDLEFGVAEGEVLSFGHLGTAHTPSFNPHRFKSYFILVELSSKLVFKLDENEASWGGWESPESFYQQFDQGRLLAVPPTIRILENLYKAVPGHPWDVDFIYDEEKEVPCIESLSEVTQLIPLSNTLPPANRTNCFLLGDKTDKQVLVDPAPKNKQEYEKLIHTLRDKKINEIFLTHHHIDHRQFANELADYFEVPLGMSRTTRDFIRESDKKFLEDRELVFYKEGDVLTTWKGRKIEIFEVPGHDNGQLALMPTCRTWCLVGDLIQGIGTVVISRPEGNMKLYFESLKKIMALNPLYIYPSHGIAMGGVHRLEETLKHRQIRENQILNLSLAGKSIEEMLGEIYPDLDEKLLPFAKVNILGHLDKLKEENKLSH
jgi:glyoxylase-like metal-dependent hydrolase (beta-lactamase superfamily II)/8-oxo-dGTP pyrophosphatase MutT (NUDIX family)